jgi:hypothetical protein
MNEQMLNISQITADPAVQPRAGMDMATVLEYAGEMQAGTQFPPVVVFFDGQSHWLADGFHRLEAARQSRFTIISADVREGGRREAVLYSVGANATHGLRRSNADKRRAVETLLRDDEWRGWSDHEIARQCAVSAMFVGTMRRELADEIGERPEAVKAQRGGTVYTVQVDGRRQTVDGGDLREEVERTVPEQISLQPRAPERDWDKDGMRPAPKMEMRPLEMPAAPLQKLNMAAPTVEAKDVLVSIRIKSGEPLEQRPITVTVAEEFGLGKWSTGVYADLMHLVNEMLMRYWLEKQQGG